MKRILRLLLCVAMLLSLLLAAGCGDESGSGRRKSKHSSRDKKTIDTLIKTDREQDYKSMLVSENKDTLVMVTQSEFSPYIRQDDQGEYKGIDVEIAKAIAKDLELELEVVLWDHIGFASPIAALKGFGADIAMGGIVANDEQVLFSDGYIDTQYVVMVVNGSPITSKDDLESDYCIGTTADTGCGRYCIDTYGENRVVSYTNGATVMQALLTGKVDCAIMDNKSAEVYQKASESLVILSAVKDAKYSIGVSANNPELKKEIDKILEEMMQDGTIDAIIKESTEE